ncbi:hypothetical protein [Marinagarivorans algicola]|uniref:hypothetical protein n=1 Tax=Marinagarivorans algicola TaxID=1513270 RepID=UPI0006B9441F|nr:hypothetical protein [Marinagarivorans algicola]
MLTRINEELTKINDEGTISALSFYNSNSNAVALTNQYQKKQHSINNFLAIKRVSDANRNPKNYANKEEMAYINKAKRLLNVNTEIPPKIVKRTHSKTTYHPILTKAMCLQ